MKSIDDPKLNDILYTSKDLFWKFGVKRVTVEEICREANVSKMTFYKFFPNKIKLAETILDKIVGQKLKEFRTLVDSNKTFEEKIRQMFIIKEESARNISSEFISDLYKNPDLGLHKKMEELSYISMNIFKDFLEDSRKKKLIRPGVNIKLIVAYLSFVSQLLENKEILADYEKTEELVMEAMNFCFYGIMPRSNK